MVYETELTFAKEMAQQAGEIMQRYFRAEDIGTVSKTDNSPVTLADTTINSLIIEAVKEQFPDDGVIGEEESYATDRDRVWVVDPVDGTAPYSLGMPVSTFLLALVDTTDGQPLVGVVYDPFLQQLYSAVRGQGAFLNDSPLSITADTVLPSQYVSIYGASGTQGSITFDPDMVMAALRVRGMVNFKLASGAYTIVRVADGSFSCAMMGPPTKPWDVAAPALIVQEAGGIVTDLAGEERRFDTTGFGCIFAPNRPTHTELLGIIAA